MHNQLFKNSFPMQRQSSCKICYFEKTKFCTIKISRGVFSRASAHQNSLYLQHKCFWRALVTEQASGLQYFDNNLPYLL